MPAKQGNLPQTPNQEPTSNISEAKNIARELHWLEKLNFAGQIALVLVGVGALYIYHEQLQAMQGQLTEMKTSGETSSDQMWSAIRNMNWIARSMDLSSKESLVAVRSAEHQFVEDRRPFIIVRTATTIPNVVFKQGEAIRWDIAYFNYGRSIAVNVSIDAKISFGEDALNKVESFFRNATKHNPGNNSLLIPPVDTEEEMHPVYSSIHSEGLPSAEDIAFINSHDHSVVVYGRSVNSG